MGCAASAPAADGAAGGSAPPGTAGRSAPSGAVLASASPSPPANAASPPVAAPSRGERVTPDTLKRMRADFLRHISPGKLTDVYDLGDVIGARARARKTKCERATRALFGAVARAWIASACALARRWRAPTRGVRAATRQLRRLRARAAAAPPRRARAATAPVHVPIALLRLAKRVPRTRHSHSRATRAAHPPTQAPARTAW
jgi:hypothetical protein